MEVIAGTLSALIVDRRNASIRESLEHLDLHGNDLNQAFGLVSDHLARCTSLKYVNFEDCNITKWQIWKVLRKLGQLANPPMLVVDSIASDDTTTSAGSSEENDDDAYEYDMSQLY